MSLNDSIIIARSGMLAHQQRINVTSNNVANVNTPGYHRQKVSLGTNPEIDPIITEDRHYSIPTGVRVVDVTRTYNDMKEAMLLQQQSDASYHTQKSEALGNLEPLLNSDGASSLTTQFQNFWNAWQDLANNADSLSYRSVLVERSAALADQINAVAGNLTSFRSEIVDGGAGPVFSGMVSGDVNEINGIATELKDLNYRISYASSGYSPNDLMDQRSRLLEDLSKKTNIIVDTDYSVHIGGQLLIDGAGTIQNTLVITNTATNPIDLGIDDGAAITGITVTGGTLGSWVDTAAIVDSLQTNLDTMANQLITSVNNILNTAKRAGAGLSGSSYDLDGNIRSIDFFTGTDASNISVNAAIHNSTNPLNDNLRIIAAAATRYSVGPSPANPGDGARALEVADLASQTFGALNGGSFTQYFSQQAATIGSIIQNDAELAASSNAVVAMLQDSIQSETGVNLDEEMIELMSAQRAYQASARLFTIVDGLLDGIINRLGV